MRNDETCEKVETNSAGPGPRHQVFRLLPLQSPFACSEGCTVTPQVWKLLLLQGPVPTKPEPIGSLLGSPAANLRPRRPPKSGRAPAPLAILQLPRRQSWPRSTAIPHSSFSSQLRSTVFGWLKMVESYQIPFKSLFIVVKYS